MIGPALVVACFLLGGAFGMAVQRQLMCWGFARNLRMNAARARQYLDDIHAEDLATALETIAEQYEKKIILKQAIK